VLWVTEKGFDVTKQHRQEWITEELLKRGKIYAKLTKDEYDQTNETHKLKSAINEYAKKRYDAQEGKSYAFHYRKTKIDLVSKDDKMKQLRDKLLKSHAIICQDVKERPEKGHWRTFGVGRNPGKLRNSF